MKKASEILDDLLTGRGVDVEGVVSEFKAVRRASTGKGKTGAKSA
ncbi:MULTISPECIES: hypothetical protein [Burkholderiaceae]|nr:MULTISPECIES: hypothetical protein [Burkholderiaceae]